MKWIALDLGSTHTKCAAIADGVCAATLTAPTPGNRSTAPGRYEVDMEAYFGQILSLLQAVDMDGASGLLLSTQMHGYVLSDAAFRPLSPYVSWQDRLAAPLLPAFAAQLGPNATAPSGVPLKANLALSMLMARRQAGEALPAGALFHTLGGYVLGRLSGAHVCHMTNAAPTGLADVRAGGWNAPLIQAAGLASLRFGRIETRLRPVGMYRNLPLYPDLGDQQVCAYGARLLPDTSLHISIGTAGLIGVVTEAWGEGPYENRPWLEAGRFLRTVSGLPGGRLLRRLHTRIQETVEAVTGTKADDARVWDWLCRIPDQAEAAHPQDPLACLALPPEAAVHSVYEAMAQAYAEAAQSLGFPLRHLAFSGGGAARNTALRTAMERGIGVPGTRQTYDVMDGMATLAKKLEEHA